MVQQVASNPLPQSCCVRETDSSSIRLSKAGSPE